MPKVKKKKKKIRPINTQNITVFEVPKVGRPSVITDEVLNKLCQAFLIGASDIQACLYAGISHPTLIKYQKDNPKFLAYKAKLLENPVLYAQQVLFSGLKDNPELALKVLERLNNKYRPKQDMKIEAESFESVLEELQLKRNNPIDKSPADAYTPDSPDSETQGGHNEISEEEGGMVE